MILPNLATILKPGGTVVALIKPQFEAGPEYVGKGGIVRDPQVHRAVLERILNFALAHHYDVLNLDYSPIKGGTGNIEFITQLRLTNAVKPQAAVSVSIDKTLQAAYQGLNNATK